MLEFTKEEEVTIVKFLGATLMELHQKYCKPIPGKAQVNHSLTFGETSIIYRLTWEEEEDADIE